MKEFVVYQLHIIDIVVLSGSPRKGGNTDLLVEAFVKGASEKHNVEVVLVRDHLVKKLHSK